MYLIACRDFSFILLFHHFELVLIFLGPETFKRVSILEEEVARFGTSFMVHHSIFILELFERKKLQNYVLEILRILISCSACVNSQLLSITVVIPSQIFPILIGEVFARQIRIQCIKSTPVKLFGVVPKLLLQFRELGVALHFCDKLRNVLIFRSLTSSILVFFYIFGTTIHDQILFVVGIHYGQTKLIRIPIFDVIQSFLLDFFNFFPFLFIPFQGFFGHQDFLFDLKGRYSCFCKKNGLELLFRFAKFMCFDGSRCRGIAVWIIENKDLLVLIQVPTSLFSDCVTFVVNTAPQKGIGHPQAYLHFEDGVIIFLEVWVQIHRHAFVILIFFKVEIIETVPITTYLRMIKFMTSSLLK